MARHKGGYSATNPTDPASMVPPPSGSAVRRPRAPRPPRSNPRMEALVEVLEDMGGAWVVTEPIDYPGMTMIVQADSRESAVHQFVENLGIEERYLSHEVAAFKARTRTVQL